MRYTTTTLTLTFDLWTLLLAFALVAVTAYIFLRFRILTKYSRLPPVSHPPTTRVKPGFASFDLHPDAALDDDDDGYLGRGYPDEFMGAFLSSIKVFGYLDRPVFHELARHLQTRKLKAGETLFRSADEERDFYIVVDGTVNVFVKDPNFVAGLSINDDDGSDDEELDPTGTVWPGHHLLNTVKKGGTISSLFTILSLFSDDIEIPKTAEQRRAEEELAQLSDLSSEVQSDYAHVGLSDIPARTTPALSFSKSNKVFPGLAMSPGQSPKISPLEDPAALAADEDASARRLMDDSKRKMSSDPFLANKNALHHSSVVARASTDATLAVIPAAAFRRLTEKFPNAAAHMVQVILTRFQRVTFMTLHRYLGLSDELLKIEKRVNDFAGYGLPMDFFAAGTLEKLRKRHEEVRNKHGGVAPNKWSTASGMPRPSESDLDDSERDSVSLHGVGTRRSPGLPHPPTTGRYSTSSIRYASPLRGTPRPSMAGVQSARLSAMDRSRSSSSTSIEHAGLRIDDEGDSQLKESIFDCVSAIIGMVPTASPRASTAQASVRTASPRVSTSHILLSNEEARQRASFGISSFSAFDSPRLGRRSSIDSIDSQDDDNVSITSNMSSEVGSMSVSGASMAARGLDIRIVSLERGEVIITEGERVNGLWFCLDGILEASMRDPSTNIFSGDEKDADKARKKKGKSAFLIRPGSLAGYLSALTGAVSFATIRAKTDAQVGFLPKPALDKWVERYPNVLLTLAKRLVTQLSPLVLHIDVAMEWTNLNAGQVLYRPNEPADSIYIILHGHTRDDVTHLLRPESFEIIGEYGAGESVGELEVLTDSLRPTLVHAIRDTEIAIMPRTLFNALAMRHPEITIHISRIIAGRSKALLAANSLRAATSAALGGPTAPIGEGKSNVNLKTIAILPVTSAVPVSEFAERLRAALELIGASVALFNTATIMAKLGRHAFSRLGKLKLVSWLSEQEENYRILLFVADSGVSSPWTQRCVRQADSILLVGLGDEDPAIGEYERVLIGMKTTARKELILLHNERYCVPGSTAAWLKNRLWIHSHMHVQMAGSSSRTLADSSRMNTITNLRNHFERYYTRAINGAGFSFDESRAPNIQTGIRSDFARLARRLLNKSIGLALGGGGARGIAHIGIIKAFEEAGIPIDMVGGTSIGSFVGGIYARESDHVSLMARVKTLSHKMTSVWRSLMDITYPTVSLFTGHEFNRAIWTTFYDNHIEDCWLPYFAVTTNITDSRMEIHRSGYMWRYIRASMSLSGYMPPLCDDGKMLLDGGYLNNLPADVIRSLGAEKVIAVDVSVADHTDPVTYGDSLSGWWLMASKWFPWATGSYGQIPTLPDIQSRLAYVSSVKQLEEAKNLVGSHYLKPPVTGFGIMQFDKFKDILQVGYKYGKETVHKWEKDGTLERDFGVAVGSKGGDRRSGRRASI
ncbi:hypothetical protein DFJ73DRAFT_626410 [Zopfochytrium polystomum]|nr:hypothetical protein DFJ73DRAFT_626410 [Zopfochytrium polystomum]